MHQIKDKYKVSILSVEQLGHSFHDKWLFKSLFLGIGRGDRIALVGANGSGKSTLLRIFSGLIIPGEGKVVKEKDLRIGYLEQDPQFTPGDSISDFIYSLGNKQQQLIRKYEELIEDENADQDILNALIDELSNENAWEYEYQIKNILSRLGITRLDQKISSLSGGQRKRLSLAKLLIDDPDIYILDEPTNHLDIEMIEWLESFLTTGNKTLLLVTHDRYFLDNICNQIIELESCKLFTYKGNYTYFLEKKSEREASDSAEYQKNVNLLRRELEWMRRQPKARTTKSKSRIDSFYDLKDKTSGREAKSNVQLSVSVSRHGSKIQELKTISKRYNDSAVMNGFNYTFKKGDRIGVAGRNGTGKSTLLNLITGVIQPDSGTIETGETTVFGYYKQGGLEFKDNERVIEVVKNVAEFITMANGQMLSASQLLSHFLFPPARQHDFVSKLSGGEKKRLQLMRVLMQNPNFLILDEPTNDLDIDTLNVLEDFLMGYPGVLMLVSHDRYLIDKLTEQLFVFEGDGNVRIYSGNYTEYRNELEIEKNTPVSPSKPSVSVKPYVVSKKKIGFKEEKEIETLETEIKSIETQIKSLTEEISSGITDHKKISLLSTNIKDLNNDLELKTYIWLELLELKD